MTYIPVQLRDLVIARANASCEYCLIHVDYTAFMHEIDHVIAEKHGGSTDADNLAYACAQCNRFKGSDIAAIDPQSSIIVQIFNPRTQHWNDHFELDGPVIVPLSAAGRTTERLLLRQELIRIGRYPFQFGSHFGR